MILHPIAYDVCMIYACVHEIIHDLVDSHKEYLPVRVCVPYMVSTCTCTQHLVWCFQCVYMYTYTIPPSPSRSPERERERHLITCNLFPLPHWVNSCEALFQQGVSHLLSPVQPAGWWELLACVLVQFGAPLLLMDRLSNSKNLHNGNTMVLKWSSIKLTSRHWIIHDPPPLAHSGEYIHTHTRCTSMHPCQMGL